MSLDHLPVDALRVAVVFACTLAAMPLLRRTPSATRRLVLVLALGGALVLPAVSALTPAWRVEAPGAISSLRGIIVDEPPIEPAAASAASPADTPAAATVRAPATRLTRAVDLARALWIVWAAGALMVLVRLGVGLARTRAILKRSTGASCWDEAAARAAARVGLRVPVRMTNELDAPAVTGVLEPVILVPRDSTWWSDERRYAVLLHELAHVRQRDCLGHVVGQLVCAAHWFDPLAWMVVRRLRVERELAADDAVVVAGARPSSYAKDLLAIAGGLVRRAPSGALGMAERSQLAARVVAIVACDRARRPPGRASTALLIAAFSAALFAIACTTPTASGTAAPGGGTATSPVGPLAAPPPPAAPSAQSTLDPRLQVIADEELERAMHEWSPAAGVVLVLDPSTGEILADAGRAHGAPADVAVGSAYLTGSTLKAVTLAAALEDGVLSPTERIDCEQGKWVYGTKAVTDHQPNGLLTVQEMLAVSSNVGFAKVSDRLGAGRLEHWLRAFHFGVAPAIEGAAAGALPGPLPCKSFESAVAAVGEAMTASPLQVAAAYAALANGGVYVPPTRTRRTGEVPHETLVRPETARTVVTLLEGAVNSERATGSKARIDGPRVAGKTGTAAWDLPDGREGVYASFVGFVPSTAPRFVILAGFEQPREGGYGPTVAAPVFARVATRALLVR